MYARKDACDLYLLSDPVDGLLVCLGQRAAMGGEIARSPLAACSGMRSSKE